MIRLSAEAAEPQESTRPPGGSVPCLRTSRGGPRDRDELESRRRLASPRIRAAPTRSRSSTTGCVRGRGGIPRTIVMLTADAFGVLPPISRLTLGRRRCITSCPDIRRRWRGRRKGVTEPHRHVQHLFWRAVHGVAPDRVRQAAGRADRTAWVQRSGSSTPAGRAARTASDDGCQIGHTRAMVTAALSGQPSTAVLLSSTDPSCSTSRCRSSCPERARRRC